MFCESSRVSKVCLSTGRTTDAATHSMKRSDVEDKVLLFGEGFETKLTDPDLKRQKILRTKISNDNGEKSKVFARVVVYLKVFIVSFIKCTVLADDIKYYVS